jgi:hypothetical protein
MTHDDERNRTATSFAALDGAAPRVCDRPARKPPSVPARAGGQPVAGVGMTASNRRR